MNTLTLYLIYLFGAGVGFIAGYFLGYRKAYKILTKTK